MAKVVDCFGSRGGGDAAEGAEAGGGMDGATDSLRGAIGPNPERGGVEGVAFGASGIRLVRGAALIGESPFGSGAFACGATPDIVRLCFEREVSAGRDRDTLSAPFSSREFTTFLSEN